MKVIQHIIDGTDSRHPLERPIVRMFVAHSGEDSEMSIERLGLSPNLIDLLKNKWGIKELYPPQKKALPAALSGKNIMLTIPTASGKSLVAHLTIAHRLKNDLEMQKALYVVPLKALASEKYNELKEIAEVVGLKVGIAIVSSTFFVIKLIFLKYNYYQVIAQTSINSIKLIHLKLLNKLYSYYKNL